MDQKVRQLIENAAHMEASGQYKKAEKLYLKAIKKTNNDSSFNGSIYINLGNNANRDSRQNDAEYFYLYAIKKLEGLKGEFMLQCGHAYFNLSYLYYLKLDARAIMYAEKTMELYIKYPLTSNTDIADIKMLFVLAKSWINEVIIENDLISTWDYIKKLEFQLLNQDIIVDYYLLLYSFFKCKKGPRFEELEKEINSLSERKLKKMQSASILGIYPYLDKINNNES